MFRKALISTLAISAAAAAPAAAKPADVNVVNTVAVAGTVGIDPAANGVQVTNTAPIPVAPVAAETRVFDARIQMDAGENGGNGPVVLPAIDGADRFQSTFIYGSTIVEDGTGVVFNYLTKLGGKFHQHFLPAQPNDIPGPKTQWVVAIPAGTIADEGHFDFKRVGDLSEPASANIVIYGNLLGTTGS